MTLMLLAWVLRTLQKINCAWLTQFNFWGVLKTHAKSSSVIYADLIKSSVLCINFWYFLVFYSIHSDFFVGIDSPSVSYVNKTEPMPFWGTSYITFDSIWLWHYCSFWNLVYAFVKANTWWPNCLNCFSSCGGST